MYVRDERGFCCVWGRVMYFQCIVEVGDWHGRYKRNTRAGYATNSPFASVGAVLCDVTTA